MSYHFNGPSTRQSQSIQSLILDFIQLVKSCHCWPQVLEDEISVLASVTVVVFQL